MCDVFDIEVRTLSDRAIAINFLSIGKWISNSLVHRKKKIVFETHLTILTKIMWFGRATDNWMQF